ncbi:hypothetical protein [Amycolatopsis minnesotensis]|uniref:Uncharacterized protein n=1 Tax=Amycolatopsis minnesotensis TaxID=337894 RepID=A0ABP5C8Q4_9PSEU
MNERDERSQAAEALATVRTQQERTRRAARLPWWASLAVFVLCAGATAANDFVTVSGAKMVALVIVAVLVVTLAVTFASGSAPLNRLRGVRPREAFEPRAFGAVAAVGGVGAWLIFQYGTEFTHDIANAAGLPQYPNTVAGVLYGAAFTALFALGRFLLAKSQRGQTG